MENEPYDYRRYDQIWQRVAPQEDPYPDVRAAGSAAPPMNAGADSYDARALLREELRHMTEVLRLLEKALA